MASDSTSQASKPEGWALIVYSPDEYRFKRNARYLSPALEGLNIRTRAISLADFTPATLLTAVRSFTRRHDGKPPHILGLGYFGHGGLDENGRLCTWVNGYKFDLTALEEHIRDGCEAHGLIIMGCCKAGTALFPPQTAAREGRIVELLAPVDGGTAVTVKWLRRLCKALDRVRLSDMESVADVHHEIYKPEAEVSYGHHRLISGNGSIPLGEMPDWWQSEVEGPETALEKCLIGLLPW